ncbi:putative sulfoacetate transporter SauU [Maritalea myrionectae]|uniref:Putative sulfoacetate transporter SauU n=1 Tax=Maritalea myrionectae TaxID=454601 RepID=A0A2R4MDJ1_9HYPH|nr:MFS transporter [Maritalea myrionectae]AVX03994.1 putative sulfoacetate transporter SauU [Maritalea myrionectae]
MQLINQFRSIPRPALIFGFANFVIAAGAFVFPFMALMLSQKLGFSATHTGLIIYGVFAAHFPAQILGGWLTDRFDPKPIYVTAIALEVIITICAGFFAETILLIGFLFLINFANGIMIPAMQAWQANFSTAKNRKIVYSVSYYGFNIGYAVGPAIGGLLFADYFRFMFWGDAATTILALIVVILFLPGKFDHGEQEEVEKERPVEGSVWRFLVTRPDLLFFAALMLGINIVYGQLTVALPLQMEETFGADGAKFYGWLLMVTAITVLVATPIIARVTNLNRTLSNLMMAGLFYAIGFGFLGVANHYLLLIMCAIVFTVGEVLSVTNTNTHIANESPRNMRGRLSGSIGLTIGFGFGAAPALSGWFIDQFGLAVLWPSVAALALICVSGLGILRRTQKN